MLIVSLQKTITNQNFYFPFMSLFSVLSVLFFEKKNIKKYFMFFDLIMVIRLFLEENKY